MEKVCGIDVAKASLDTAVSMGHRFEMGRFANAEEGFVMLLARARELGVTAFAMEATGSYHKALKRYLESQNEVVYCLSPLRMRRLAQGLGILDKDDPIDAQVLSQAMEMSGAKAKRSEPLGDLHERLLEISRRIDQMVRSLARERTRLKEPRLSLEVEESLRRSIGWQERELEALRATWMQLSKADPEFSESLGLVLSVPNVGPKTATTLLSELPAQILKPKGIVALAGLAPRRKRSGTSLQAPERISRACNARLKRALYMPAIQALRRSPDLKDFYMRLIAKGKHPKQAIVAVMHKILRRVVAVLRRRSPWTQIAQQP